MRIQDLTPEQQAILSTDFGAETEKVAAEQAKVAGEMYNKGLEIALNIADAMDKQAAEAEKIASESDELNNPEAEKIAAQMGAFIERGQYDGLRKLGSDRHGNEWHYIAPFVEEKVASAAAKAGLDRFRKFMAGGAQKAKDFAGKAKDKASQAGKAVKDYHKGMADDARSAATGRNSFMDNVGVKGNLNAKQRAAAGGKALAKASPYLAAGGAAGYAASRKKDD
jgi:hypothetical protein